MTVTSTWHDTGGPDAIDPETWSGSMQYIEEVRSQFGVMNDSDAVCIGIVPYSRKVMAQIAGAGCIFWFNEDARDGRFGIRFPQGDPDMAMHLLRNIGKSETIELLKDYSDCETDLAFMNDDAETVATIPVDTAAEQGIAVWVSEYNGRMLLALRIPFVFTVENTEYRIEQSDDAVMPVVIEAPKLTPDEQDEQERREPLRSNDPYIRRVTNQQQRQTSIYNAFQFPVRLELNIKLAG